MNVTLIVSFPLDTNRMIEQTDEIVEFVGQDKWCGSGTDFERRDVEFSFDCMRRAGQAGDKVVKKFPTYEIHIVCYHDE